MIEAHAHAHARQHPRCPYCHETIAMGERLWRCPKCHTRHRAECARETGRCTVMGCRVLVVEDRPRPVEPSHPPTRFESRTPRPRSSFMTRGQGWFFLALLLLYVPTLFFVVTEPPKPRQRPRSRPVAAAPAKPPANAWDWRVVRAEDDMGSAVFGAVLNATSAPPGPDPLAEAKSVWTRDRAGLSQDQQAEVRASVRAHVLGFRRYRIDIDEPTLDRVLDEVFR